MMGEHELRDFGTLRISNNQFKVVSEVVNFTTFSCFTKSCMMHLSNTVKRRTTDAALCLDTHFRWCDVF